MKKRKHIFVWLLIIAMLASALSACNKGEGGTSTDTDNEGIKVSEYIEVENFYATRKAGEPGAASYTLKNSFRDDNCWYFVYYLGRVEDVPLSTSADGWEKFTGAQKVEKHLSSSVMTANEVAQAVEHSNTRTDGWSEVLETTVEASLSASATVEKSIEAAVEVEGIGVGAGASTSKSITATLSAGFSKAVGLSKEHTNTLSQFDETTKTKTVTESKETVYTFDPEYTPAGYYKFMHFAAVDVFGIVIYNPTTGKASVSSVSEYALLYTSWAYSEDMYWESKLSPEKLSLDAEGLTFTKPEKHVTNPDAEMELEQETTEVTVDFTHQYGEGEGTTAADPVFTGYNAANFTDGIFKAKGTVGDKKVTKYILKGCYNTQNKDGDTSKYILQNFTVQIDSEHDIEIVLDHISFQGGAGRPAIRLNPEKSQNITVTLTVMGESILYGADGQNAKNASANGENGAAGIDFSASEGAKLIIGGISKLTVVGGNGGNGALGANGMADGESGTNGGTGGNGSAGIIAKDLAVSTTNILEVYGGNGGNGAKGGNGYKGKTGWTYGWNIWPISHKAGPGEAGGAGGRGGNGGNGAEAIISALPTFNASNAILISGNGGNGGMGGDGGQGGNGGYNEEPAGVGGDGGQGGAAGNGGNAGNAGVAIEITSSNTTSFSGSHGAIGVAGTPGLGGMGGVNANGGNKGASGAPGASGADGSVCAQ